MPKPRMRETKAWALVEKIGGGIWPNSDISDSFSYQRWRLVEARKGFAYPNEWRIARVRIVEIPTKKPRR